MAGSRLDPRIVEAFVNLYETNVLRDLDARRWFQAHARHGDIGDDLTLVA
jgi:hypothetical protein